MKIKVAILEKDTVYLNRVVSVFNSKYADKLEIYSFTEETTVFHNLEESKIDVLLSSDSFKIDTKKLPKKCGFAYMVESPSIESLYEERTICKFQKADLIYKEILGIYSETTASITGIRLDSNEDMKMISVISASGGTGSSTMAVAIAISAARRGKKVLYLNLEQFGDTKLFFQAEGQADLNDVIYAIKSKRSNLALKLESAVKQDASGVFFYDTCKMPLDITGLNSEDMARFINELKVTSSYDYIILDFDFAINDKNFEMLKKSRRIVFVNDGSEISNIKFHRALLALAEIDQSRNYQIVPRIGLLYNKFSSKTSRMCEHEDVKSFGGAPKYEGASPQQIVEQLISLNIFNEVLS